jgi:hypothetical protein
MAELPGIAPPAQPIEFNAFSSAMSTAAAALGVAPDAVGQNLLSGLDGFTAQEGQFRATLQQAVNGDALRTDAAPGTAPGAADPNAGTGKMTTQEMMQHGEALQQRSMGLMMQTYSFALEATLVTNAATTFTSSINTLIKTQ